jgi:hypothetical protein
MIDYKKKYAKSKLHNLGQALAKLRAQHAEIKEAAALVWAEVDYLRLTRIPEELETQEVTSVKIKGVGTLSTRIESSCSTKDKPALIAWLHENGYESIISQDTINASTLKAFINNQIKAGDEIPSAEIVKFSPYEVAVITK